MSATPNPRLATESIAGRRPYQEDAVLSQTLSDGRLLLAVADGMGGHAAGEVASALALETLVASLEDGQDLAGAFTAANRAVRAQAREPGKQGMGTTLVAALQEGASLTVANVGDSRAYRLSAGAVEQLTEDHSFVTEAVKRGQSEEEARASQWKDALTRSIGTDDEVKVDTFGPFAVEDGSALLLCSDGLYKTLEAGDILDIFQGSGGPRGAAQSVVSQAFERGSDDNISVVIAEWGEVPRHGGQGTMPMEYEPPADTAPAASASPDSDDAGEDGPAPDGPDGSEKKGWWKKMFS